MTKSEKGTKEAPGKMVKHKLVQRIPPTVTSKLYRLRGDGCK